MLIICTSLAHAEKPLANVVPHLALIGRHPPNTLAEAVERHAHAHGGDPEDMRVSITHDDSPLAAMFDTFGRFKDKVISSSDTVEDDELRRIAWATRNVEGVPMAWAYARGWKEIYDTAVVLSGRPSDMLAVWALEDGGA